MITHFTSVLHSPCRKIQQQLTRSRYSVQLTKCRQSNWGTGRAMTFQEKLTIFSQVSENHLVWGFFMVICFPTKARSFQINTNQQRSLKMTNKCIVKHSNHRALLSVKLKKKILKRTPYTDDMLLTNRNLIYSYRFQN